MKVLLVDDSVFVRTSLKKLLDGSGYNFTYEEASTGKEAVRLYKQSPSDLVIMDIEMPEMDGITAIEKIREIDSEAKIIMCSADGYKERVIQSVKAGAAYFVAKPYEPQNIIDNVKKVLNL